MTNEIPTAKLVTACPGCRAKFSIVESKCGNNYQCSQCGIPFILGWDKNIRSDEPELIGPTSIEEYPPYPLFNNWTSGYTVLAIIGVVLLMPLVPFVAAGVGIHYAIWAIERHQAVSRNQKKAQ